MSLNIVNSFKLTPPPPEIVGGWKELGRTTLGAQADVMEVSSFADKRYYMVLTDAIQSGNITTRATFNSDSGTNYAVRQSNDGGAESTPTNAVDIAYGPGGDTPQNIFSVMYLANLATKEKLQHNHSLKSLTGGGNPPSRKEQVAKWANTTNPIDTFTCANDGGGSYAVGSEVVVLEWDPADIHTDNFWEVLIETDLVTGTTTFDSGTFAAKKYLWVQTYIAGLASTNTLVQRFNTDSTSTNYSNRFARNGAADGTSTNRGKWDWEDPASSSPRFINQFIINNSSHPKYGITNALRQEGAGAGNAPTRTEHVGQYVPTTQITSIQWSDFNATNNVLAGSKIRVWGSD